MHEWDSLTTTRFLRQRRTRRKVGPTAEYIGTDPRPLSPTMCAEFARFAPCALRPSSAVHISKAREMHLSQFVGARWISKRVTNGQRATRRTVLV